MLVVISYYYYTIPIAFTLYFEIDIQLRRVWPVDGIVYVQCNSGVYISEVVLSNVSRL